ncbi:diacylglycerol kinase [Thiomonas intermedia]|uniref:diacylglycerol kinase n=1 Tax=Thiomonas intermedia TaxID=926 RepID=UPI0009A4F72C|nr:diacylglycerol kinase [Thiomonas intermedia]
MAFNETPGRQADPGGAQQRDRAPASPPEAPPHPYKTRTGLSRVVHAGINSLSGLCAAWQTESAFRQELTLAVIMLPLALWLGRTWAERAVLAGCGLLVLIVELLNTAIEYTVDRVSLERNPLSKTAKDLGSAAVLLTLLLCVLIWASVLLPRL